MNAQIWRDISIIAEDESMMKPVDKYLRKVTKEMTEDSMAMSKEEYSEMLPGEDLTAHLRELSYDR